MSRDSREGYQQSQRLENDGQSLKIKGLNELSNDIVKFKFCKFLDKLGSLKEGYLTDSDIFALSSVSKTTQGLFQPNRLQILADKLLLQVMKGEQAKAEVILKRRPELLLIKGTATDYSGRTFECTAFQYALWALDTRYMCQMMLDCLPYNPEGERIKKGLLEQLLALESDGIQYQLNARIVKEKHYDFIPLLKALKNYVDNYDHWCLDHNMYPEFEKQWELVGLAQRYVPAHVAQHYCDPEEAFYPTPKFNKPKFVRVLQFFNVIAKTDHHWFSPDLPLEYLLSRGLGFIRQARTRAIISSRPSSRGKLGQYRPNLVVAYPDLVALNTLYQVRTKDLEQLKSVLEITSRFSANLDTF